MSLFFWKWWLNSTQLNASSSNVTKRWNKTFFSLENEPDALFCFRTRLHVPSDHHLSCDASDTQKQPKPVEFRGRTRPDVCRWLSIITLYSKCCTLCFSLIWLMCTFKTLFPSNEKEMAHFNYSPIRSLSRHNSNQSFFPPHAQN